MKKLIYSQIEKGFRRIGLEEQPETDWFVIGEASDEQAVEFICRMQNKHNAFDYLNALHDFIEAPTVETIEQEFLTFINNKKS